MIFSVETINFKGSDSLTVYQDGNSKLFLPVDEVYSYWFYLKSGENTLKWVFDKQSLESYVAITSIVISGSTLPNQSASACWNCPAGFFNPKPGQTKCQTCPLGMQGNEDGTACVECPANHYAPFEGWPCFPCPEHTFSKVHSNKCVPKKSLVTSDGGLFHLHFFNSTIEAQKGVVPKAWDQNLCSKAKSYCTKGFFGPIIAELNSTSEHPSRNYFYVSPVYPSSFKGFLSVFEITDTDTQNSIDDQVYIVGLYDKTMVKEQNFYTEATSAN